MTKSPTPAAGTTDLKVGNAKPAQADSLTRAEPPSLQRIAVLERALRPFEAAWSRALEVAPRGSLAEMGAIAGHHVSAVDFRQALSAL